MLTGSRVVFTLLCVLAFGGGLALALIADGRLDAAAKKPRVIGIPPTGAPDLRYVPPQTTVEQAQETEPPEAGSTVTEEPPDEIPPTRADGGGDSQSPTEKEDNGSDGGGEKTVG